MTTRRHFLASTAAVAFGAPAILRAATAPLATIGLVADGQYADIEPAGTRFYRGSVEKLGKAVEHFNGLNLACCLHLGDLIDRTWGSYDEILKPLAGSKHRFHHLLGNHDFDVLNDYKTRVPERLGLLKRYYSVDQAGFRFVILDTTDLSTYAHPAGSAELAKSQAALDSAKEAKLPQAQPWNGGLGAEQLSWLDKTCLEAAEQKQRVMLFAHHPVFPANPHNLWNSAAVLDLIKKHRHIVAWFNGHNHAGNFGTEDGVPFVNLKGMVETADTTAFATAELHEDRLVLSGQGREISRELVFRKV